MRVKELQGQVNALKAETERQNKLIAQVAVALLLQLAVKVRSGSSIRLVRLKPQGPGPKMGPNCPV